MCIRSILLAALCAATLCRPAAFAAPGDDPEVLFDTLFGDRVREVTATRETDDDLALAQQLVQAAESLTEQREIVPQLCDAAYTLAIRSPLGAEVAVRSLRLLADHDPALRPRCHDRIIEALSAAFAKSRDDRRADLAAQLADALEEAADAEIDATRPGEALALYRRALTIARTNRTDGLDRLQDKSTLAVRLTQAIRQVDLLKQQLRTDPSNVDLAHRLVMAYLVRLDSPPMAWRYGFLVNDDQLRHKLRLADLDIEQLEAEQCFTLGQWYAALGADDDDQTRATMLDRALGYYRRFLVLHETPGLQRTAAELAVKQLEGQLESMQRESGVEVVRRPRRTRWRSLMPRGEKLSGWTPTKNSKAYGGAVNFENGVISLGNYGAVELPLNTRDLFFRAKVRLDAGSAYLTLRANTAGRYSCVIDSNGKVKIYRSYPAGTLKTFTLPAKPADYVDLQFGAADNHLFVLVNGKRVLHTADEYNSKPGHVALGVGADSTALFRDVEYFALTDAEIQRLRELD